VGEVNSTETYVTNDEVSQWVIRTITNVALLSKETGHISTAIT
jgi:hypothetical protein